MRLTANRIAAVLRKNSYKLTPQRRAVLEVISSTRGHLTPEAIHERVIKDTPGVGLVTVYRTLNLLIEMGLVCKVHVDGNCRSYLMRRPTGHHHHLICSSCGKVADFTDCNLTDIEGRILRQNGFKTESHLLEFQGTCHNCQVKALKAKNRE